MAPKNRKFTQEEVLAAVAAADTPLSTSDIAQACARSAGLPAWSAETGMVAGALTVLAAAGKLVTSKRAGFRGKVKPGDVAHAHIVRGADAVNRWWATPEISAKWRAHLDQVAQDNQKLATLADQLETSWNALGGPVQERRFHRHLVERMYGPERAPDGLIHLDLAQLDWLQKALADLAAYRRAAHDFQSAQQADDLSAPAAPASTGRDSLDGGTSF